MSNDEATTVDDSTLGLMICRARNQFSDHDNLEVRVMARSGFSTYPQGVPSWFAMDKKPYVEDLLMRVSVWIGTDGKCRGSTERPEFELLYAKSIDYGTARAMADMLAKIAKIMDKEASYEVGDKLMALGKAVGARWVCVPQTPDNKLNGHAWASMRWSWCTLTEGRNRVRDMLADLIREAEGKTSQQLAKSA